MIDLWIYARRVTVRAGRSDMGRDCCTAVVGAGGRHSRTTVRSMLLRDDIDDSLKSAMKAGDTRRVSTLRLVNSEILKRETSATERVTLSDPEILDVMGKMIKQRQESLDIHEKAGRNDLATLGARGDRDHLRLSAAASVGHRGRRGHLRADKGTRGGDDQGHGPHHGGAEGALCRADGLRQGQRDGEEALGGVTLRPLLALLLHIEGGPISLPLFGVRPIFS